MADGEGRVGTASGRDPQAASRLRFIAYVAFLLLYGNAKARLMDPSPAGSPEGVLAGLALVGLVGAWAFLLQLDAADLGVALRDGRVVRPSLVAGILAGLFFSLFPIAAAALRLVPADRPETGLGWPLLLWRAIAYLPLDTALPEELAFRGLLLAWLLRAGGLDPRGSLRSLLPTPRRPSPGTLALAVRGLPTGIAAWIRRPAIRAVLIGAVPFVFWHLQIAWSEMSEFRPVELAGKLAAYYAGGVLFGYLRAATGHLAGSIVAHWLFGALAMLVVRLGGPGPS